MFGFRRHILRSVPNTQLAGFERDVVQRICGLQTLGSDDLCLKAQLQAWLAFDHEQKTGPFTPRYWLTRQFSPGGGATGSSIEPPSVFLRQRPAGRGADFSPDVGKEFDHPSVYMPNVWVYPIEITPARAGAVIVTMIGWIGELRLLGFEEQELLKDYPYSGCQSVEAPVVRPIIDPTPRQFRDPRLSKVAEVMDKAIKRSQYSKDVVILNRPFLGDHIADYELDDTVKALLCFSNGMKVNDFGFHAIEGRHETAYVTWYGRRDHAPLFARASDGAKVYHWGRDSRQGKEFYLLTVERTIMCRVYEAPDSESRPHATQVDAIDLCISYLRGG